MAAPEMTSVYGKVHATVEDTSDGEKGETLTTVEFTTAREKKLLRKIDTMWATRSQRRSDMLTGGLDYCQSCSSPLCYNLLTKLPWLILPFLA